MLQGIYVVTDSTLCPERRHREIAAAAVRGGACCVQLRDKSLPTDDLLAEAQAVRDVTRGSGVLFVVNDNLDVAVASEADGVHLGQGDTPARAAARVMRHGAAIGVSARTVEEAVQAESDGASYIGFGPVFATSTKPDAGAATGLDALREVKQCVGVPVVAIGGITLENVDEVAEAGADMAAVISAVVCAPDMATAVAELAREFEKGLARCGRRCGGRND